MSTHKIWSNNESTVRPCMSVYLLLYNNNKKFFIHDFAIVYDTVVKNNLLQWFFNQIHIQFDRVYQVFHIITFDSVKSLK